jgi:TPR repeat protein
LTPRPLNNYRSRLVIERMPRPCPLALTLLLLAGACGTTQLTPQQELVMAMFAECKTRTNAVNVTIDQVYPDGRWTATVVQTQSEYNHLVACMQDDTVLASLFRRQADSGDGNAMANLGRMYEDGRGGLAKDDAEAVQWYRRGAEARNGQAMASLGYMYEHGRGGLAKSVDDAALWYRRGADTGDRVAMYYMGRAYEFGLGVTRDRAEAVQWYRKSAAAGFTPAVDGMKNLGE